MKLYKTLGKKGQAYNGGKGKWKLPEGCCYGEWMPPVKGHIVPCANGYHLCRRGQLINWLGPTIWLAEGRGDKVAQSNKIVYREARLIRKLNTWNDRTMRLFAADCAERVVTIYEKEYPDDDRPRLAIQAARDFANGKITKKQLDAARAAAWNAARDAAGAAARDAAWAAARAAARDAARAAAWNAAQKWQTRRLFEYLDGKR